MSGIIESASVSGGMSLLSLFGFYLWKKWRNKQIVCGCLIPKGKTYFEKNLTQFNNVLFFDMDGFLSISPLYTVEKGKRRLEHYPKALNKLEEMKKQYKNIKIVICSSDQDLIKYLNISKKHTLIGIGNPKFFNDNKEIFKDEIQQLEKLNLEYQLLINKKTNSFRYDTFQDLSKTAGEFFNKLKK